MCDSVKVCAFLAQVTGICFLKQKIIVSGWSRQLAMYRCVCVYVCVCVCGCDCVLRGLCDRNFTPIISYQEFTTVKATSSEYTENTAVKRLECSLSQCTLASRMVSC